MNYEQILQKAIDKAEKNGWRRLEFEKCQVIRDDDFRLRVLATNSEKDHYPKKMFFGVSEVIFSHDFAKAFFGERIKSEEKYIKRMIKQKVLPATEINNIHSWQHHLRRMVLLDADKRLKYIEKHL